MTDDNVISDPFARYVSRVKDARLEQLNAICEGAPDSRSARSDKAILARRETITSSQDEIESASAPSSRAVAEFAARTGQFLKKAAGSEMIERDYLAKTRPGLLGLPKRVGLKAIRYPVKTYTDGLFAQQEAFNSLVASFISENAAQIGSLLETGNELEHEAQLQQEFNRNAIACVSAMSDAIASLWGALQEQNEFNSQITSLLNDVIDGTSELVASVKERTDQRLAVCENRLDSAEDILRQQAEENTKRFEAAEARTTSLFEVLEANLSETRNHLSKRIDSAEARIEAEAGRVGAVESRADISAEQLGLLDERCQKSEARLDSAEDGLTFLGQEQLHVQKRSDEIEGALRAHDERFEEDERHIEDLASQLSSTSQAVQDTHSFFSLQLDAVDARIEHAQIRQHEASEWMAKLEGRLDDSDEWLTNLAKDADSTKDWLTNVGKNLDSTREWLDNVNSEAQKHGEWLSAIETDIKTHSDWLGNLETTTKEHNDWLSTITESKEKLDIWTGNLQRTQDEHASLLSDLTRHQKEIDYQIVFVKRKLDEAQPSDSAARIREKSVIAEGLESGLTEDEYVIFEDRFRGESSGLKARQQRYLEHFEGCKNVIDLGCGRGEFLELLNERGVKCLGIDSNTEMIQMCKSKGLEARQENLVAFLEAADDASFDGVFCSQVVEHFSPGVVLRICKLIARKLSPGAAVVVETIDPRSIYALVNSFLLDPSHVFPVHPGLLEFGFSLTDVELEGIQHLAPVPEDERLEFPNRPDESIADGNGLADKNFRRIDRFLFGFQDYALIGRKAKA